MAHSLRVAYEIAWQLFWGWNMMCRCILYTGLNMQCVGFYYSKTGCIDWCELQLPVTYPSSLHIFLYHWLHDMWCNVSLVKFWALPVMGCDNCHMLCACEMYTSVSFVSPKKAWLFANHLHNISKPPMIACLYAKNQAKFHESYPSSSFSVRYNISTDDYHPWLTDSTFNENR